MNERFFFKMKNIRCYRTVKSYLTARTGHYFDYLARAVELNKTKKLKFIKHRFQMVGYFCTPVVVLSNMIWSYVVDMILYGKMGLTNIP